MSEKAKQETENLTPEQINEFSLNKLGYYCKVRTVWNAKRGKSDYMFDIIQYEGTKEVIVQKGQTRFEIGEQEAIKKRNHVIDFYLKNLKNN